MPWEPLWLYLSIISYLKEPCGVLTTDSAMKKYFWVGCCFVQPRVVDTIPLIDGSLWQEQI